MVPNNVTEVGKARIGAKIAAAGAQIDLEDDSVLGVKDENAAKVGGIAQDRLRNIVERIERLDEERRGLTGDIKDIYAEAKSAGFEVKVLRALIAMRKKEAEEVEEMETLLDVYRRALGM